MDKYEYKVRSEEIKALIAKREYQAAMKIADTIDWTKVKSVIMLCTISDLYKVNRRYEESKELLLMAYERHPGGRMIVYSLCELSIKLGEVVQAVEYYKQFVQVAPMDNGRFILQYKLYEAQEVSLEERIAVLEELKRRDYREKWAYELAYLYHRIGLSTRCVEECDELILWFGEGKYVTKAMELKMLHCPLSPEQQKKYKGGKIPAAAIKEKPSEEEVDIHVKPVNVGQYDTINLQKELAESMKEVLNPEQPQEEEEDYHTTDLLIDQVESAKEHVPASWPGDETGEVPGKFTGEIIASLMEDTAELQEAVLPVEEKESEQEAEQPDAEEIFFEDTDTAEVALPVQKQLPPLENQFSKEELQRMKKFENMLAQEYDGQIRLVMPDTEKVEKQITGQMSIEDILAEWEKMKKENEQKRAEDVRKRVLEQTGAMFSEFDASTKQGVLAELENMAGESIRREAQSLRKKEGKIVKLSDVTGSRKAEGRKIQDEGTSAPKPQEEELPDPKEAEEGIFEDGELPQEAVEEEDKSGKETSAVSLADGKPEEGKESGQSQKGRTLTRSERQMFGSFIQTKATRVQVADALDKVSLAAYTGNVIITGEAGCGSLELARNMVKEIQMSDNNFSGRVAKITGRALNGKNIENTVARLENGALIVEKAGDLKPETVKSIEKALEQEKRGIVVILEDTKLSMNKLLEKNHTITKNFNARIDIEALDNDSLVMYGRRYAQELEYSIDELGVLALYTRIADMQTSEHAVTISDVKEIVDEAIRHANKKNISHFIDILLAKRYDDEDMIILREKDFIYY